MIVRSRKDVRDVYNETFGRNLGILSGQEQEVLRLTKIAMLGLGGIGGPCFEVLVRCGIGRFAIVDRDVFDRSNFNRQNFATKDTLDKRKIDVAEAFAYSVNEELVVKKYLTVTKENVSEILNGASVVVHAIDTLKPCIISSREARERGVPIVEGWALPYGNVRVITPDTPTLEELYNLPTVGKDIDSISDEDIRAMEIDMIEGFSAIEGVLSHYQDDVFSRVQSGANPSFAPMVWFASVMMAIETIKLVLKRGRPAVGPDFVLYDPFGHVQR